MAVDTFIVGIIVSGSHLKDTGFKLCVVIPCFKVTKHVDQVIAAIDSRVHKIYAVDDGCPDQSGDWIEEHCKDPRVTVLRNPKNLGVGGAVTHGLKQAINDEMDIAVKIDGDGQMDPAFIKYLIDPIINEQADYTKGNRFYKLSYTNGMPLVRLLGNGMLSFITKFSSGYWHIADPTNGFTAISLPALEDVDLDKISKRYFFESDFLYHLYLAKAVVVDVPMKAKYADEESNLSPTKVAVPFAVNNLRNFMKRIVYTYFVRDFSIGSFQLLFGLVLTLFGVTFGSLHWLQSSVTAVPATVGTIMVAALPFLIGIQMLLSFLNYDITLAPRTPISAESRRRQLLQ